MTIEEKSGKTRRHKLLSWFLKHVLFALFIVFVTFFALMNFYQVLHSMNVEELISINLLMSSFVGIILVIVWNMNWKFIPLLSKATEKGVKKRRLRPLSQRLASRKYYLLSFYCFTLLTLVSLIFLVRAYWPAFTITSASRFILTVFFLEFAALSVYYYQYLVQDRERAVFYLRSFNEKLEKALDGKHGQIPSAKLLSDGFKYYEKSLASPFKLKSIKEKLRQIRLVLERGSKGDCKKLLSIFRKIVDAIEKENHEEFDTLFIELRDSLNTYVNTKKDVIELGKPTRMSRIESSLSQLAKPIAEKVVPWLVILAIVALISYLSGIRIPPLNP